MHVAANLEAVATESHFSASYLFCQRFVDLVASGEKEVQVNLGRISLISFLPACWAWTAYRLLGPYLGTLTILKARAGRPSAIEPTVTGLHLESVHQPVGKTQDTPHKAQSSN